LQPGKKEGNEINASNRIQSRSQFRHGFRLAVIRPQFEVLITHNITLLMSNHSPMKSQCAVFKSLLNSRASLGRGLALCLFLFGVLAVATPTAIGQGVAQPQLKMKTVGGRWQLQLIGQSNRLYRIESSPDMVHWNVLAQRVGSPGTTINISDPQAGQSPRGFYRAVPAQPVKSVVGLGAGGYAPDTILVKPKPGMNLSTVNLSLGAQVLRVFPRVGNLHVIKVPNGLTAGTLMAQYQQSGLIQYAEHNYYVHAMAVPNDQYYTNLWAFHNTGQFGGKTNTDIHAQDAWDIQNDAGNIIIAVVDTGVRYTHEDVAANMWRNPRQNQDGYANDQFGINVTTNGMGNGDPMDDYGHGTHVAGIMGAVGNNSVGVVGVAWRVQIMACKFLDSKGDGTIDGAIACMDFARDHGARIVNASWGASDFTSQALHDAVASLRDAGIILVAAAGNSQENDDQSPIFPAGYSDLDNVIAVAATDPSGALASFSAYGATSVSLGAPGVTIGSCWNSTDHDYQYDDGTSMAAAMVSGAAAVMAAHFPGADYRQIKSQMIATVDPEPTLTSKSVSGGRLNLAAALKGSPPPPPALAASFSANPPSGPAPLTVTFTDTSTGNPVTWNWNFGDGSTATTRNPSHTFTNAGNFTVALTVTAEAGQSSSASHVITVTNGSQNGLPLITLQATQPDAYESGAVPGEINFHRTGDTSQAYEVFWSFSGTASNGVDFEMLPTDSPFPEGLSDATLTITPIDRGPGQPDKTVIVTLQPGQAYQVGASNSATIIIHGTPSGPVASFTANPTSGQAPLTVQFTDTSTGNPTARDWNFGDGSAHATTQNPTHTYTSTGTFTATLTVSANGQTSSAGHTITVTSAPPPPVTAAFAANPTSGQAPLAVQFTDQSSGPVTAWNWKFGDGSTSSAQNPSHTYSGAGTFTATLTVTGNSGQSSSVSHTITVTSPPPPVTAAFAANPTSGQAPLAVQFTDQSSGPVTAWNWRFGDGSTSSAQNPSHTYSGAGTFTATLTVTGNSGQSSSVSHTITVTAPPPPSIVTVVASQPLATSLTPGVFTLRRTGGDTSSSLSVSYSLGGTARNGAEYQTLSGVVTIPAGSSSATVTVRPLGLLNVLKTVVLTVTPESGYNVGSPSTATVTIVASLSL
jgi:PKD repeat protein